MRYPPRRLLVSWAALAMLLGGNVALAFIVPAALSLAVNLLVAAIMAGIVLILFMELGRRSPLIWVFAGAGFFWLAILFCLTAADYLTRYNFAPT